MLGSYTLKTNFIKRNDFFLFLWASNPFEMFTFCGPFGDTDLNKIIDKITTLNYSQTY